MFIVDALKSTKGSAVSSNAAGCKVPAFECVPCKDAIGSGMFDAVENKVHRQPSFGSGSDNNNDGDGAIDQPFVDSNLPGCNPISGTCDMQYKKDGAMQSKWLVYRAMNGHSCFVQI